MKKTCLLFCAALVAILSPLSAAETLGPATPALHGDPARPANARWLRSEIYFGIGRFEAPGETPAKEPSGISEARWREFLDREVTPRFPDGLTVFDAYGQWLNRDSEKPGRLRSKVLVILHADTPENRTAIDAIRVAWKSVTRAQSVLVATSPVEISF